MVVKEEIVKRVHRQYINLKSNIRRVKEEGFDYSHLRQRRDAQRRLELDIKADRLDMRCHDGYEKQASELLKKFQDILTIS